MPNRFNLPEILFKQPTSAKLSGVRPGVAPVRARGGPGWWGELDPAAVPAVASLVETELRPGAEGVIETVEGARPVLSSWRYGLGRVTAMPTEPVGAGTGAFDEWPDYGRFLARTLERTARDLEPFAFQVQREGRRVRVVAERRTQRELAPWAARVTSDGAQEPLVFEARAPGRFEATLRVDAAEVLTFGGGAADAAGVAIGPATRFASVPAGEHSVAPESALDLVLLAEATGGALVLSAEAVAGDRVDPLVAVGGAGRLVGLREWRPWLVALALLVYLADVLDRRLARRVRPLS